MKSLALYPGTLNNLVGGNMYLLPLDNQIKPAIAVELGTHYGVSFFAFCEAAEAFAPECFVYAVDCWEGDDHSGKYGNEVLKKSNHLLKTIKELRLIKSKFEDAVPFGRTIDLLHIDGLHTYEAVKKDYETWSGKLRKRNCFIHDINAEKDFGAWKYWQEFKQTKQMMTSEVLNGHGLGIGYSAVHAEKFKQFKEILPILISKGLILERMAKAELKLRSEKE